MNIIYDKYELEYEMNITFHKDEEILWVGKPNMRSYGLNTLKSYFKCLLKLAGIFVLWLILSPESTHDWIIDNFLSLVILILIVGSYFGTKNILDTRSSLYIVTNFSIIKFINRGRTSTYIINKAAIVSREITLQKENVGRIGIFIGRYRDNDGEEVKDYDYLNAVDNVQEVFKLI